ncbi:MAG: hypothetical protein R2728_14580 [Chitinophagales bacterium]
MSNPKPYILTHLLTNGEAELFSKWIKQRKKNRLALLFIGLKSSNNYDTDKTSIFKKVYNDSYTIEKDYLLRNDLRKLSTELTNFIIEEICKIDDLLAYYDFLIHKKAFQLFEKEIKKTIANYKKKNDESHYPYQKLWFEYIVRYTPRKKADLEKYHRIIHKTISETPSTASYYKTNFILLLSILERIRWQYFQNDFTDLDTIFNTDDIDSSL